MTQVASATADTVGLVHRLLTASLVAWKVTGHIERDGNRITLVAGAEPRCPMIELGWKSVGILELTALPIEDT